MTTISHATLTGTELHEPKGVAAATGGTVYVADGAGSGSWTAILPPGVVAHYGGSSAPSKWLFCYGQAISRSTYATLYANVGTTFGVGDGATTFNLPDCRGRVNVGKDNMGGSAASRVVTGLLHGVDGATLGAVGGEDRHTMTVAELVTHKHNLTYNVSSGFGAITTLIDQTTANNSTVDGALMANTGSSSASNMMQPSIVFNTIIYAGV